LFKNIDQDSVVPERRQSKCSHNIVKFKLQLSDKSFVCFDLTCGFKFDPKMGCL